MRLHIAYIAGYFDADGCVTAHFGQQANRAYRPWVGIDLTFAGQNYNMLDEIRQTLGCGAIRVALNATKSGVTWAYASNIEPIFCADWRIDWRISGGI